MFDRLFFVGALVAGFAPPHRPPLSSSFQCPSRRRGACFLLAGLGVLGWNVRSKNPIRSRGLLRSHWSHALRFAGLAAVELGMALVCLPAGAADKLLLVTNREGRNILRYDADTGAFIDVLVPAGTGGMNVPFGMAIGPDGNLYVASTKTEVHPTPDPHVRRFDVRTGAFLGVFASGGGMVDPIELAFGSDGHLYVSDFSANKVFRFNGATGAAMGVFATGERDVITGGGAWGPDGNFYLAATGSRIPRFDVSGARLPDLQTPQTAFGRFDAFGPDGALYATDYFGGDINAYDIYSGALVKSFQGLNGPQGFAFSATGKLWVASYFDNRILSFVGASGSPGTVFTSGPPLDGPLDLLIVANSCEGVLPKLSALISSKVGIQDARKWTIALTNKSYCPAEKAQIDGLKLTQTYGVACTPVITSPIAFPLAVGDIAASGKASGDVTINFSGCASTARFTAKITYSANDGAVTGSKNLNNQFR
jgi:streptogramin lyase